MLFTIQLTHCNPEWHKSAIWYQIFPDRFYNGDPSNDPTVETLAGTWPYEKQNSWQVMPWTSDWYKPQPWEIENGGGFYYNAQLRRYGGDIQGIIDKLDYLHQLGINAIYLNPIFESPSSHKYGTRFYHHIDNNFGPDPLGDEQIWKDENPADPSTWKWTSADKLFLELVKQVHYRGMKIIIDGVFNHVGIPFWAFEDVRNKGKNSQYVDWFTIHFWDDSTTSIDEFDYDGWNGIKDLPVLKEDENGLILPIQDHIHEIIKRWMDPNGDGDPSDGIDGWRLDVAEQVDINFWRTFNKWVTDINPEAYLTGEVWWDDFWTNEMINAAPWLGDEVFDGVMNYRLADALFKFFIDKKKKITRLEFANILQTMINDYGLEQFHSVQNVLGSHDIERIASACVNPDRWIDHANNLQFNPEFKVHRPNSKERQIQKLLIAFQFLFPGNPYIYYGDEAGMWGADDPDCRKPMVWSEFDYENEVYHPYRLDKQFDSVAVNSDLMTFYSNLIQLRKKSTCLNSGEFRIENVSSEELFVFSRFQHHSRITAIFNRSDDVQQYPLDIKNVLNNCVQQMSINSTNSDKIRARDFQIWTCNDR